MGQLRHDRQQLDGAASRLTDAGSDAVREAVAGIAALEAPWGPDAAGQAFAEHYLPAATRALLNTLERPHQLSSIGELLTRARQLHQDQEDQATGLARTIEAGPS